MLADFRLISGNILLQRLAVVIVYALLAKGTDIFIDRFLRRLVRRTSVSFDDLLVTISHGPICWTVLCLGLLHAFVLQPLPPPWQMVLPGLAKSIILTVWWLAILRMINLLAEQNLAEALTRGKVGQDLFYLLKNIVRVVAVIVGLLWLLAIWRVDLTPLFASAGIVGIAVALAAKDTLANFFGGISIFADNTFKVGDYIILDGNERGEVVEIGIRSTRIKTRDGVLITIPNSVLANSKIINESAPIPRFRIRIPIGVAYGSDLAEVEKVLLAVAHENSSVLPDPAPRVRLRLFGDSSVDFQLLFWVAAPSLKGRVSHDILMAVYQAFGERDIVIPFPQRDVHIMPPAGTE